MDGVWKEEPQKHRNILSRWSELTVNLGETVVVGWKGGGGQVLVEDLDNEGEGGGVACWLNGTRRLDVDAWRME